MKVLAVLFQPFEAAAAGAFSQALGAASYDAIQLCGDPVKEGPTSLWLAADANGVDAIASAVAEVAKNYTQIIAVSSMASKDLLPRLAEHLDAPMVSDVIAIEGANRYQRPILAGSVIANVEVASESSITVLTFRPSPFPAVPLSSTTSSQPLAVGASQITLVSKSSSETKRPDLSQAKVVVSGGKPLKDAETFERIIGGLADKLGGAVGATRAAVDAGIAPNELQVGQTGKVVAPDLYIAAGISGSTQHLAGIKDSKLIVAINKDPDAPIFAAADLGLVADLFEAVPELTAKIPTR